MWSVSDLDCYYVMNEAVKITKEYHKKSESPRKGSHIHTRAHLNAIHYNVDRRDCPEPKKNNEIRRKVHTHTHTRVTIVATKDERVNLACEYFYYRNISFIIVTDVLRSVSWCERSIIIKIYVNIEPITYAVRLQIWTSEVTLAVSVLKNERIFDDLFFAETKKKFARNRKKSDTPLKCALQTAQTKITATVTTTTTN